MLKTADRLAGRDAGRGRPALCDLRRATSSAYYALFHQITRHGVYASIPTADEHDVALVARWFTHQGVRAAADAVVKAAGGRPGDADVAVVMLRTSSGRPVPPDLLLVAEAFGELQDARHDADYSNDYDPVRYTTIAQVDLADRAVRATWSMWRASRSSKADRADLHDSYRRFLQLALLRSGGPKNRR